MSDASSIRNIVIVGGGQAGAQAAISLRQIGFGGSIALVGAEPMAPYQRPPLSKAFLKDDVPVSRLMLRPNSFYTANEIDLRIGDTARTIDRAARSVMLSSGETLPFDRLIIATGSRNRELQMEGVRLPGVYGLRTIEDARLLRSAIKSASSLVIVGGGFIGLEVAAAARALGVAVTVLEGATRLMGRSVSPVVSEFFLHAHRAMGSRVVLGAKVESIAGTGRVEAVVTQDGVHHPCEATLIAVGVEPNVELARDSGLVTENEIVVDEFLATTDPRIFAIGDCASFASVHAGMKVRLESVQNAVDQAKCVASNIVLGARSRYTALPWFWSEQGDHRLQIVGLTGSADQVHVIKSSGEAIAFCFRAGRLIGVETVNQPGNHIAARKLLSCGLEVRRADLERFEFDLIACARAFETKT